MRRVNAIMLFLIATVNSIYAQSDTTKNNSEKSLKKFEEIIKPNAKSHNGIVNVYQQDEKVYLGIPKEVLGKDMLLVSRVSKAATAVLNAGEELNNIMLNWEKENNRIFLRAPRIFRVTSKDKSMQHAIADSDVSAIFESFPILAYSTVDSSAIIEVTKLFKGDLLAFNLSEAKKKLFSIGGIDDTNSYITTTNSFKTNFEIRSVKTYKANNSVHTVYPSGKVSMEISNSFILLPDNPMIPRYEDQRVGYFSQTQFDFGIDDHRVVKTNYIRKWRLEPKDSAAYFRGELVEPVKPIVFYIDPNTPKKWVPYLIQGVKDWSKVLEKAGFKDAIYALEAPSKEQDPDFDIDDVRYSVIRYAASEKENAYGPHIADPRTGEIINSNIIWFHNVMNLLNSWYFVQTAAVNPQARNRKVSDEEMGNLIRYVSSHEVGHTLGLHHNFIASNAYPVDSLRSASFTQKNGTTPSIMDYARFNYVAQPEDKGVALTPKIGPYDNFAIEWGYRLYPNTQHAEDETIILNNFVKKHVQFPEYRYTPPQSLASKKLDPRAQIEDLGDNAMKANTYGIKNLQFILKNMKDWTYEEASDYSFTRRWYNDIRAQWRTYINHVANYIGGVQWDLKYMDQKGEVYTATPKELQFEAIDFLNTQLFNTPNWILDKEYAGIFDPVNTATYVESLQKATLEKLLHKNTLKRIVEWESRTEEDAMSAQEYLKKLTSTIFDQGLKLSDDPLKRKVQRSYIYSLKAYLPEYRDNDLYTPFRVALGLKDYSDIILTEIPEYVRVEWKRVRSLDGK